jgi:hypothetical protein
MVSFAERMGLSDPPVELSERALPDSLRNGLWSAFYITYLEMNNTSDSGFKRWCDDIELIGKAIYHHEFRLAVDTAPTWSRASQDLKMRFWQLNSTQVYSFIEFVASVAKPPICKHFSVERQREFLKFCNSVLEREKAPFRFADDLLIRVTSPGELAEVERALLQEPATSVSVHIAAAAKLYSEKDAPDYRNSVKEAISAVESAVSFVLDKKVSGLDGPLKEIARLYDVHPALTKSLSSLYGFTSDAGGIRHALMDDRRLGPEYARFMLVSCSAFANFLLALKASRN